MDVFILGTGNASSSAAVDGTTTFKRDCSRAFKSITTGTATYSTTPTAATTSSQYFSSYSTTTTTTTTATKFCQIWPNLQRLRRLQWRPSLRWRGDRTTATTTAILSTTAASVSSSATTATTTSARLLYGGSDDDDAATGWFLLFSVDASISRILQW